MYILMEITWNMKFRFMSNQFEKFKHILCPRIYQRFFVDGLLWKTFAWKKFKNILQNCTAFPNLWSLSSEYIWSWEDSFSFFSKEIEVRTVWYVSLLPVPRFPLWMLVKFPNQLFWYEKSFMKPTTNLQFDGWNNLKITKIRFWYTIIKLKCTNRDCHWIILNNLHHICRCIHTKLNKIDQPINKFNFCKCFLKLSFPIRIVLGYARVQRRIGRRVSVHTSSGVV